MVWIIYGLGGALFYGLYNLFTKLSGENVHPALAYVIISLSGLIVSSILLVFYAHVDKLELSWSRKPEYIYPVLTGVVTCIAEMFYLNMYKNKAPLGIGTTFTIGLTIVVTTILGILLLKEVLKLTQVIGIIVTLIGVALLSL